MFVYYKLLFGLLCLSSILGLIYSQTPSCPQLSKYCTCAIDNFNDEITLDCSQAKTEDQLEDVFTLTFFPTLNVYKFVIENNTDLKYLTRNVFGNVTFELISLKSDVIQYIGSSVFLNSVSTLTQWEMYNCSLPSNEGFPFYSLNLYTKLKSIYLDYAGVFDVLPVITSNSLSTLHVSNCSLQNFPIGAFNGLPRLSSLLLNDNNIVTLVPGLFEQNPVLSMIDLHNNNIDKITSGTFRNSISIAVIYLYNNKITHLEPGAFFNLTNLVELSLGGNQLRALLIENLGHLPSLDSLDLHGNSISFLDNHLFSVCCPALTNLIADVNNLTSFEKGMFDVLNYGELNLSSNKLTILDENWLKTPLEKSNTVKVDSNPLLCGCDMAWLYADQVLMNRLSGTCSNGTDIANLNSLFFINNC